MDLPFVNVLCAQTSAQQVSALKSVVVCPGGGGGGRDVLGGVERRGGFIRIEHRGGVRAQGVEEVRGFNKRPESHQRARG